MKDDRSGEDGLRASAHGDSQYVSLLELAEWTTTARTYRESARIGCQDLIG